MFYIPHQFENQSSQYYQLYIIVVFVQRMLLQACRNLAKYTNLLSISKFTAAKDYKKLNTEVFSQLSYSQISNPIFTKQLIIKPIHNHSRMSQRYLYHRKRVGGIIRSCFSEKKHKQFRRVHKIRRQYYSQILNQKIPLIVSTKAFRTINKMGSFDNYILCTKPKDLDSKYGEYLRELMLRKINNQDFRIPYIIGTARKLRSKVDKRKSYISNFKKIMIPKSIKEQLRTFQRKFGNTPDELNNQDYAKYVELQKLKKLLGDDLEPTHPLLLQLKQKMKNNLFTEQQQQKFDQMAKQAEQKYVNDPKHGQKNKLKVQKAKLGLESLNMKIQQIRAKIQDQ